MEIEYYDKYDNKTLNEFKVMQIPISYKLIQDCYSYAPLDAPSELKLLFLEQVAKAFDELIIKESQNKIDKWDLMNKLDKIEIKYKDAR